MTQPSHIFIGGVHRSGTDLIRNILNSGDDVAICGETHFFGHPRTFLMLWYFLGNRDAAALIQNDSHFQKAFVSPGYCQKAIQVGDRVRNDGIEKICDLTLEQAFWVLWLSKLVTPKEFLHKLLESDRTDRSLFEVIMACYAGGKSIRGEKTPAHIHFVPTLLDWFPNAKFIHMLRDPRAILMSQKVKKAKEKSVNPRLRLFRRLPFTYDLHMGFGILVHWLRIVQLHYQYQTLYPNNYFLLKFEDLIKDPYEQLQRLADFLDIEITEKMLQSKVVNSSFVPSGKISGFDKSVVDRWREQIHPATNRWLSSYCKKYLIEFGYRLI